MVRVAGWRSWFRQEMVRTAGGTSPHRDRKSRRLSCLSVETLEQRIVLSTFFPADNPWNQVISNAPVAANSAAMVNSIGLTASLHPDFGTMYAGSLWGIPYSVVSGTQPKQNVVIDKYPSESDQLPVPFPSNANDPNSGVMEGDPLPGSQNTTDRHVLVYDQDNHILYELFHAYRPSEEADGQWHAGSEAVWHTDIDYFRTPGYTSADAAGLPMLPGLVRYDEVTAGVIDHALRFTVRHTRNSYVFPASHYASSNSSTSLPRMGERFRLKASFDVSSFPADDQVILTALKTYGMMVADNGGNWFLSGAPDPLWNVNDLNLLKQVTGSDFEAVDLTPQVSGLSVPAGSTAGGDQVTINGLSFSGGAGLTKVYFGSTQAASIQILSDSQIVATTPAQAAGTVDVTVQSGYGTSAVSAADRFTYVTQLLVAGFPASTVAATAASITVTAADANGNTIIGYTGTVHFTSSDAQAALPVDYTFVRSDHGTHTFTVRLKTAGTESLTATDKASAALTGSETGIVVLPAAAKTLVVTGFPSPTTAGVAQNFTVTAKDAYGNTVTGYAGTVHFSSTDSKAVLPSNYAFLVGDAGVHSFSATLKTAGLQSITAKDTVSGTIKGTQSGITVNPVAASRLKVSAPSGVTAGTAFNVTVTALDPYGNTATGYTGTVHLSSSDGQATLPPDYTFTSTDAGKHTFTGEVTLKKAGKQTIKATDTVTATVTGSATVIVTAAAASTLSVHAPATVTAGTAFTVTLTALDPYGNKATGYRGTVHFTSSDPAAVLPLDYTFTVADSGGHSFSNRAILKTAGAQSITATDTVTGTITGRKSNIQVNPGTATILIVSGFPSPVASGTAATLTLTAEDAYGNVAAGYRGTVHFSSTDGAATLPANYTLTSTDAGVHTFTATLKTNGTQSITATDAKTPSITGTESGIEVTLGTPDAEEAEGIFKLLEERGQGQQWAALGAGLPPELVLDGDESKQGLLDAGSEVGVQRSGMVGSRESIIPAQAAKPTPAEITVAVFSDPEYVSGSERESTLSTGLLAGALAFASREREGRRAQQFRRDGHHQRRSELI